MTRLFLEELAKIQERLQALFEPALLPSGYSGGEEGAGAYPGGWTPPLDLVETEDLYLLCAELPGARREDVEVRVTGRTLELAGSSAALEEGQQFLRMERNRGRFHRVLELGGPVDTERISVELEDGILTARLPKQLPKQGSAGARRPASGAAEGDSQAGEQA